MSGTVKKQHSVTSRRSGSLIVPSVEIYLRGRCIPNKSRRSRELNVIGVKFSTHLLENWLSKR